MTHITANCDILTANKSRRAPIVFLAASAWSSWHLKGSVGWTTTVVWPYKTEQLHW
jgi:hypothetical protein